MAAASDYDVIIIGSGAGGGTLAYALAPTGKRILLLERGDYVRREKENWDSRAVNVDVITGVAPDAGADAVVLFVQHNTQRHMCRQSLPASHST